MKLYIIGNGFDLHHSLKTGYIHYKEYLAKHNPALLKAFCEFPYFNHSEEDYDLWTDLESSLSFDFKSFSDECFANLVEDKYPNLNSDYDYTWDEIATETDSMISFIHDFTGPAFYEWLKQIPIDSALPDVHLNLSSDSKYISFNYTSTLETVYHITPNNILHIHGRLEDIDSSCFLGSKVYNPARNMVEVEVVEPIKLAPINNHTVRSKIQFGSIQNDPKTVCDFFSNQFQSDDYYGASIKPAIDHIFEFCTSSSKNLYSNYDILRQFVSDDRIDEIIVMGHSFDGVDSKYYMDILFKVFKNCKWVIYYRNTASNKKQRILEFFNGLNVIPKEW